MEMRKSMPTLRDFTGRPWQEEISNAQMKVSILDGKGALMPAFRGRVTEDQAQDLVGYVRAFGPVRAAQAEPPPAEFEKRMRELQDQWLELQKQLKELKTPPRKP
jgi:hypothetical protein